MSPARLACQAWSGEATQQAGGVLVAFFWSAKGSLVSVEDRFRTSGNRYQGTLVGSA